VTAWRLWVAHAIANAPRTVHPVKPFHKALFSDASLTGWGAILIQECTPVLTINYGKWSGDELGQYINDLEAFALRNAVGRLPYCTADTPLKVFIDNTALCFSAQKGRSRSFQTNEALVSIQWECERKLWRPQFVWISTLVNLADAFTRLEVKDIPLHGVTLIVD
jgi:hypothetical protein